MWKEILLGMNIRPWENQELYFILELADLLNNLVEKNRSEKFDLLKHRIERGSSLKITVFAVLLCGFNDLAVHVLSRHKSNTENNDWIGLILIFLLVSNESMKIKFYYDQYTREGVIGSIVEILYRIYIGRNLNLDIDYCSLNPLEIFEGFELIEIVKSALL